MKKISIDNSRVIASFLVVAIHIYPFLNISPNLDFLFTHVFCRIAVPFFFMITGYYLIPKSLDNKNTLIDYTKKIIRIYLITILLYLPINLYTKAFKNISILKLIKAIFIEGTFYHLWYFPALILGIWLSYYLIKHYSDKKTTIIILLLYLVGLLGDSYYGLITNFNVLKNIYNGIFQISTYTRNGLFYAPIFICLGYFISKRKNNLTMKQNILFLFIFLFVMEIEGYLLHILKFQRHDSMYLFLIPTMFFLFQIILKGQVKQNKIIRNIATVIYIIHPMMIIVVRGISKVFHLEKYLIDNNFIQYIAVILLSILFSLIYVKGKRRFKDAIDKRKRITSQKDKSLA